MTQNSIAAVLHDTLADIAEEIDWDNWQTVDEDGKPVAYWSVLQVLWCRLQWLHESAADDEARDTLAYVQGLIERLQPFDTET